MLSSYNPANSTHSKSMNLKSAENIRDDILQVLQLLIEDLENELKDIETELRQKMYGDDQPPKAMEMPNSDNLLLERWEVEAEKAKTCLGGAITMQPDIGPTNYITAAQLPSGVACI